MADAQAGIWSVDWLVQNSQRKYPLHEDASITDTTGTMKIPNDFIVDMIWPVHADATVDPTLFHIIGIGVFGTGVTVSIGYNGTIIGSVSIDAATFVRNQTFLIAGTGNFFDSVGKIVIGTLDSIKQFAGSYTFDLANGQLEPTVIKPDVRGVNAIYLKNGTEISDPLQDDLVIQAGERMKIDLVDIPGEPSRIVFNAVDGLNLNAGCECSENQDLPCVKTINGIQPDTDGDFKLLEDECLKLEGISNGIQLTDACAKPCCGCEELQVVQQTLEFMVQQVTSLENQASRLEAAIQTMEINLLSGTQ